MVLDEVGAAWMKLVLVTLGAGVDSAGIDVVGAGAAGVRVTSTQNDNRFRTPPGHAGRCGGSHRL